MSLSYFVWRAIAQSTMGTHCIVIASPAIELLLCIREREELLRVQALIPQTPVERFDIPVPPGTPGLDEQRFHVEGRSLRA